jgi:hypothetical protein
VHVRPDAGNHWPVEILISEHLAKSSPVFQKNSRCALDARTDRQNPVPEDAKVCLSFCVGSFLSSIQGFFTVSVEWWLIPYGQQFYL